MLGSGAPAVKTCRIVGTLAVAHPEKMGARLE
jgi:hypothetical protein